MWIRRLILLAIFAFSFTLGSSAWACSVKKCKGKKSALKSCNKKKKKIKKVYKKMKKKLAKSQSNQRKMMKIMYTMTTLQASIDLQKAKGKRLQKEISNQCTGCSN